MFIEDTIAHVGFYKSNQEQAKVETLGDRIDQLLKEHGRRDRGGVGNEYEQQELWEWMTGIKPAPNGKKYNFSFDKSHISKLIRNKIKYPPPDELKAIKEIFGVSLDWLYTGEETPMHDGHDVFFTSEAGDIAAIVDRMDEEDRKCLLRLCQRWQRITLETDSIHFTLRDTQKKLVYVLDRIKEHVPAEERQLIDELVALSERTTKRLPG